MHVDGGNRQKPIDFQRRDFQNGRLAAILFFYFPGSNFILTLNINSNFPWHITYVYGYEPIDFQQRHFQNFSVSGLCRWHGFWSVSQVCFRFSISNSICMLTVVIDRSLVIFSDVTFKMTAWWPYCSFIWFPDSNFSLALNMNSEIQRHNIYVYG